MSRRRSGDTAGGRDRQRRSPRGRQPSAATTARRRAARGTDRRPWIIAGGIGLLIILGLSFIALQEITRERPGIGIPDLGNQHIASVDAEHRSYNSSPPTSGPHVGGVAPPNIYNEQVPDELQVHNLEDGFVIVQYDCPDGCPELVSQLADVVGEQLGSQRRVILAPYTPIRDPKDGSARRIALTAWTRIDTFDDFDAERIAAFIETYEGIDHHVRGL